MAKAGDIKVDLNEEKIEKLIDAIENSNLNEEHREQLICVLKAMIRLDQLVGMKDATIAKLRKIFGKESERNPNHTKPAIDKKEAKGTTGGTGRRGHKEFGTAQVIEHAHESLKEKDVCPECYKGRLYPIEAGVYVRIKGNLPLEPVIHRSEKLRCNLCGQVFEADFTEKHEDKFDPESRAILSLLHYKASLPFYRQEMLYRQLGVPLARSTLWLRVEELADYLHGVWKAMLEEASKGSLFFIDDTKAKILSLMRENELNQENKKFRKGIYTTGILSEITDAKVVLYLTGRNHSGENIKELIERNPSSDAIAIMSDALKVNDIESTKNILHYLCLVHGRRNFIDVEKRFQEESQWVIDQLSLVYKNEAFCKAQLLSSKERLLYHQKYSKKPMNDLKAKIDSLFTEKKVEPNSELGKAIKYMQKHWQGLSAFLRHEGAPIDNNILEQQLRMPVLNRKNWLFFKNEYGAYVGDIILSMIKTCDINGINAFEYLVTIQKQQNEVKKNPSRWLPWNFNNNSTTEKNQNL